MFIALMFLPLMRWLSNRNVPKHVSIFLVVSIIVVVLRIGAWLIKLSSREILTADASFYSDLQAKLLWLIIEFENFFGIERMEGEKVLAHYFSNNSLLSNFGNTINFIGNTLSMTLMTAFFAVLWLSESINFQKLLNTTILKQTYSSVKVFMKIEKELIKFIFVKVLVSMLTGISVGLACYFFDISFPIFWGLFAFAINFLQMIGSFISVIVTGLFAFIEHEPSGTLLLFIFTLTAIQALFGGVIEPVLMGKSFSINIITILIMLMFWGFLWGVPGLIMSIPITVFIKIILEQYPNTKFIADLMSGPKGKNIFKKKG
jgi:predicted PurR-regulated permease PerM